MNNFFSLITLETINLLRKGSIGGVKLVCFTTSNSRIMLGDIEEFYFEEENKLSKDFFNQFQGYSTSFSYDNTNS